MECYSGEHEGFNFMTSIDYCGAFVANGQADPIE